MAAPRSLRAALAFSAMAGAVGQDSMPELMDQDVMWGTLRSLDAIAKEAPYSISPNGTRDRSSPGHNRTVEFLLESIRNISSDLQPFQQTYLERGWRPGNPVLEQISPSSQTYRPGFDYTLFYYSPAGTVENNVVPVSDSDPASEGCELLDFARDIRGKIALIKRGSCGFSVKAENAKTLGAVAVIVYFLEGQDLRVGRISAEVTFPMFAVKYEVGQGLVAENGNAVVRMVSTAEDVLEMGVSNIIVDIEGENKDGVVMVGAHMDSVPAGPGVNDNGSGTSVVLEMLRAFVERFGLSGDNPELKQSVRFAWWGSEEWGLLGSRWYVANLTEEQKQGILGYINIDMAGSRNGINGIANAQFFDQPAPADYIQYSLQSAYEAFGESWILWQYTGSDHTPFFQSGVPAGAIFSGATIVKDEEMAEKFGGTAGQECDSCYHLPCDTADGIDMERLHLFSKVGAKVLEDFASDADLPERLNRGATPVPTPAPPTPAPAPTPDQTPGLILAYILMGLGLAILAGGFLYNSCSGEAEQGQRPLRSPLGGAEMSAP